MPKSEVAVYKFAILLGVNVCPAWFVDEDTIFSQFVYDFTRECFVHARHFIQPGEMSEDRYPLLIKNSSNSNKT